MIKNADDLLWEMQIYCIQVKKRLGQTVFDTISASEIVCNMSAKDALQNVMAGLY